MVKFNVEEKTVELKTSHGTMIVRVDDNPGYEGFVVDYKLKGHEEEPALPIVIVEDAAEEYHSEETNGFGVAVRVYDSLNDDKYDTRVDIPLERIKKAYKEAAL